MSTKRVGPAPKPNKPLQEALRALVAGLEASARPSMIIGGIAVIARGVTRLTRDIDATVVGAGTDVGGVLEIERDDAGRKGNHARHEGNDAGQRAAGG